MFVLYSKKNVWYLDNMYTSVTHYEYARMLCARRNYRLTQLLAEYKCDGETLVIGFTSLHIHKTELWDFCMGIVRFLKIERVVLLLDIISSII